MITNAAVKIFDKRQNKEIIIPCHRHCDAFWILKQFGYKKNVDYTEIAQGFLDEVDNFYTRVEAKKHAEKYNQIAETEHEELYTEDLW
jgi:hypothetical protein